MRSMAEAICLRTTCKGRSMPAINTKVSRREMVSRGLLAWTVVKEPSWPVFIACSISKASPARTSPTTMRSGRIRNEFTTRSRMLTGRSASMEACLVSKRTT